MFYDDVITDHLSWLNDSGRNNFYKKIILENCKDKVCVDVGSGTGILTDYALDAGATKVYAIEIRKSRAKFLKEKYKSNSKVVVVEEDFLGCQIEDNIDYVFIEQIGCQFANDFSIKRFMQKIKLDYPNARCIPDNYRLKAIVYDGMITEKPKVLVNNDNLPKNFYSHCQQFKKYKETETLDLFDLNLDTCDEDITFDIDLTNYVDCTIFIDDVISFEKHILNVENTYRDWEDKPLKLFLKNVKGKKTFTWQVNRFITD